MGNANEEQTPTTDDRNADKQQDGVKDNVEFVVDEISAAQVAKPRGNAYVNFVQAFQKRYRKSNQKSKDVIRQAAAVWRSMTNEQKQPFIDMAQQVKTEATKRPQYKLKRQSRRKPHRRIKTTVARHHKRRVNPYSTVNTCSRMTGSDLGSTSNSTSASSVCSRRR